RFSRDWSSDVCSSDLSPRTSFRSRPSSSRERRRRRMKDMRRLSDNEIADQLRGAREELFDAKFRLATRQLKNFRTMPQARRKIRSEERRVGKEGRCRW